MNYVLGLDIGIASVGWAVIDLETLQVIESCSNIFTAAEAENNKDRRSFRQMRRLKRRLRTRISDFAKMWKSLGFSIPGDIDNMPLLLRVKGISEELSMDEIYTVLLNELKHRGISYLEDFGDNANDGTDYSKSIAINQKELEEKFPCQIQYERYCKYGNYRGQFVADINGEKVTLCNVFTTSSYRKEITSILDTQKKFHSEITDKFIENYMKIFDRKREYYVGPGNDNSRTDYGIYTTKMNDDGTYKTDKNLFEKLIGKCSVYNEELRAAAASYTAQEFNVLNDLNTRSLDMMLFINYRVHLLILKPEKSLINVCGMKICRKMFIKIIFTEISGARLNVILRMLRKRLNTGMQLIQNVIEVYAIRQYMEQEK